ncbi:MAG: DGQHR domain-containing protein, partial [Halobacteriaceae archaeon]
GNSFPKKAIERFKGVFDTIEEGVEEHPTYSKYENIEYIIVTRNFDVSDKNKERMENYGIHHWDDDVLDYYDNLYGMIGEYAKYNLLGELGVQPITNQVIEAPAFKTTVGGYDIFTFFVNPKELLKYSYVARRQRTEEKYYQRFLSGKKIRDIGRFLDDEDREVNLFPNNIIVSINKELQFKETGEGEILEEADSGIETGLLSFPKDFQSCWIIDGQHRLYGYAKSDREDDRIPITAFAGNDLDLEEQARVFVDINENQKSVDPNLIWDLHGEIRSETKQGMISRIVKELNSDGVLQHKIFIPSHGISKHGKIKMNTLCGAISRKNLIDENPDKMRGG